MCVVSLFLRSAPLHVLRGGGAESENYCPGFAENSRERKLLFYISRAIPEIMLTFPDFFIDMIAFLLTRVVEN